MSTPSPVSSPTAVARSDYLVAEATRPNQPRSHGRLHRHLALLHPARCPAPRCPAPLPAASIFQFAAAGVPLGLHHHRRLRLRRPRRSLQRRAPCRRALTAPAAHDGRGHITTDAIATAALPRHRVQDLARDELHHQHLAPAAALSPLPLVLLKMDFANKSKFVPKMDHTIKSKFVPTDFTNMMYCTNNIMF
jgi:hypothetical protein